MPWETGAGVTNRAGLLLPDGRASGQDKLSLTPGEQDPESWNLVPGDALRIVEWGGLKLATLVCLDIEMPALSMQLAALNPHLLLVPSMPGRLSGYSRVSACDKARTVCPLFAVAATATPAQARGPIARASCRERGWRYVVNT